MNVLLAKAGIHCSKISEKWWRLPFDKLRVTVLFDGGGNVTSRVTPFDKLRVTGVNNIQFPIINIQLSIFNYH
jgi:hypothetical protein